MAAGAPPWLPRLPARTWLWLALGLPIAGLLGLTIYKQGVLSIGRTITLPVRGYDPRDLLSGHYIRLRPDYGIEPCRGADDERDPVFLCLHAGEAGDGVHADVVWSPEAAYREGCPLVLRGACQDGTFIAGLERFYVPEAQRWDLDALARGGQAAILVAIDRTGRGLIKELLIDGRPWRERAGRPAR